MEEDYEVFTKQLSKCKYQLDEQADKLVKHQANIISLKE